MFEYKKPKNLKILFIVYILIIVIFVFLSKNLYIYSKINIKAIVKDNTIIIPTSLDNVNFIVESEFYKINNKKYVTKIKDISDVYNDSINNYQDITLLSNNKNYNNQVIDITFYYDRNTLCKKILKGVLK